jgi:hypothetical protein
MTKNIKRRVTQRDTFETKKASGCGISQATTSWRKTEVCSLRMWKLRFLETVNSPQQR